jgi:hypothetical protein
MSMLDQQVRRTRFRLTTNVTLGHLALGVLIAAAGWTLIIVLERALVLGIPLWPSAAVVSAAGLIVAAYGVYRDRIDQLHAAVVLDEAAGLKERVSTALAFRQDPDPFAQATIHDAEKVAGGVHVPTGVPYRAPDLWPWSLATVVVAVIFFNFMPQLDLLAEEEVVKDDGTETAAIEERRNVELALNEQVERVKQRLQDKPELAGLLDAVDKLELPDEPTQTPEDVRREAVKKIEKVSDSLKQQLEADAMNALEQLKRELAKLETPKGDDPGSKLTQALAAGDMEAAKKAMSDLKKMLEQAAQNGDAEAQKKIAEMEKKLDDLAKQLEQLADSSKLQKDLENKGGLSPEEAKKLMDKLKGMDQKQIAEALKKQLAKSGMSQKQIEQMAKKIAQNQKAQQQLKSMAQAMSKMAQACKQCQGGNPGNSSAQAMQGALDGAMGQMSDLEMTEQMMNELEAQLAELKNLKAGVCQGGNCRGPGDPNSVGRPGPRPGYGYGPSGDKQRGAHGYKSVKEKTRTQGGKIIGQMLIDGPQIKGEANAEVTNAVNSAVRDAEDAIEREQVPRQYQRVVQAYFEQLAGLMSGNSPTGPESKEPGPDAEDAAVDEDQPVESGR